MIRQQVADQIAQKRQTELLVEQSVAVEGLQQLLIVGDNLLRRNRQIIGLETRQNLCDRLTAGNLLVERDGQV